jgi:hypothetical protein
VIVAVIAHLPVFFVVSLLISLHTVAHPITPQAR